MWCRLRSDDGGGPVVDASADCGSKFCTGALTGLGTAASASDKDCQVVLSIRSAHATDVAVSPESLVFGYGTWDVPQLVTVSAVEDSAADGDTSVDVTVGVDRMQTSPLLRLLYDQVPPQTVVVEVEDSGNTAAGFSLSTTTTSATEGGTPGTFTVRLNVAPSQAVVIEVVSSHTNDVAVSPLVLTFTPYSWNVEQSVTADALEDGVADGMTTVEVTLTIDVAESAPAFSSVGPSSVLVRTIDSGRGVAGFTLSTTVAIEAEQGNPATVTVQLNIAPSADVILLVAALQQLLHDRQMVVD